MKKNHNVKIEDYSKYDYADTRYYGLFLKYNKAERRICLDTKRYKYTVGGLSDNQIRITETRNTHYFRPAEKHRDNYMCNIFVDEIISINDKWQTRFKPLIKETLSKAEKPKEFTPGDCELYNSGIFEPDETSIWVRIETARDQIRYKNEYSKLANSLYSQFVHQLASSVEAITVKVLTIKNGLEDKFNRNVLYATATGKEMPIKELPSFKYYDVLYCLWNFLKHNSMSTYASLKKAAPELLIDSEYMQGDAALYYIRFSDSLIESLIDGNIKFFKEYCKLVFNEDFEEAQWNYDDYFLKRVKDAIDIITNPLGIPYYL